VPVGPRDQTGLWRWVSTTRRSCSAELVARASSLSLATEYAKVRGQFDRPIAFQAIRHKAVEIAPARACAKCTTRRGRPM
jgi:hypothetical protein